MARVVDNDVRTLARLPAPPKGIGMRMLVLAGLMGVVGCSAADDAERTGIVTAALDAGADGDAGPARECNGANMRHVCESYPATAGSRYGALPTCTNSPFMALDGDGGIVERGAGQAGCIAVGYPTFDGAPVALCCP